MKENAYIHDMATKALYNSILLYGPSSAHGFVAHDHTVKAYDAADWKARNWREMKGDDLFAELALLGTTLDKRLFLSWAAESDSPEDLLALLIPDEVDEMRSDTLDHIYLILFELWRRYIPERRPISILADEIDHAILEYDTSDLVDVSYDRLLALLLEYVRILQTSSDHVDEEEWETVRDEGYASQSHAIFHMTQAYFVHDIARFIFDFVLEELNHDSVDDIAPLVEGIAPFIMPPEWGECMRAHLMWYTDEERAVAYMKKIAHVMCAPSAEGATPDTALVFGILLFAAKIGEKSLFIKVLKARLSSIDTLSQDEAFELLSIACLYAEIVDHPLLDALLSLISEIEMRHENNTPQKRYDEVRAIAGLLQRLIQEEAKAPIL